MKSIKYSVNNDDRAGRNDTSDEHAIHVTHCLREINRLIERPLISDIINHGINVLPVVHTIAREYKECPICYTEIHENDSFLTNCGHEFHQTCLEEWFKRSGVCPLCRYVLAAQPSITFYPDEPAIHMRYNSHFYDSDYSDEDDIYQFQESDAETIRQMQLLGDYHSFMHERRIQYEQARQEQLRQEQIRQNQIRQNQIRDRRVRYMHHTNADTKREEYKQIIKLAAVGFLYHVLSHRRNQGSAEQAAVLPEELVYGDMTMNEFIDHGIEVLSQNEAPAHGVFGDLLAEFEHIIEPELEHELAAEPLPVREPGPESERVFEPVLGPVPESKNNDRWA